MISYLVAAYVLLVCSNSIWEWREKGSSYYYALSSNKLMMSINVGVEELVRMF